ncbi:hypothetical protein ACTHSJ_25865 [Paenibacillus cellulositrophicus]|uniref:hypothetical protein n=1 Tax=Paenibacillus cellulositrophicus TaxID=562959 RepID=UPI003F7F430E
MKNIFEIKQLETKLINWTEEAEIVCNHFDSVLPQLKLKVIDYNIKIVNSFTKVFYKRMSDEEQKLLLKEASYLGLTDAMKALLDEANKLSNYGPINGLANLRIYSRKINSVVREFHKEKKIIRELFARLKEIDMKVRELSCQSNSDILANMRLNILVLQQMMKEYVDMPFDDTDRDCFIYVEALFSNGKTINRDDMLQVITLNKELKYWDGIRVTSFKDIYSRMPEEIDYETFKDLIFIKKIEHPDESYLFDYFLNHVFKVRDQYEAETGEKVFDAFEVMEEITGKPLQTYTAEFDEYGDAVSMTPNKPNLKVVEGAHEQ